MTTEEKPGTDLAYARSTLAERPARRGWHTPSRPRDAKPTDGVARTLWEAAS